MNVIRAAESLDQTRALGKALASLLRAGDVVAMHGPLGAGKTELARAIAEASGVDPAVVASPTFVIVHEYTRPDAPDLVHVDAYRLDGTDDLDTIGWDVLTDGSGILLIEWAERIADALPAGTAHVNIELTGDSSRVFRLSVPEEWADRPGFAGLVPGGPTRCPVTGVLVDPACPTYPFADERARLADLYRWFSGSYGIGREIDTDAPET